MSRVAVAVLLIAVGPAMANTVTPASKCVDVVLCLDASNRSDGLIASAKVKRADIVNELAKARPAPELRVALYRYENDLYDRANGWVCKELDAAIRHMLRDQAAAKRLILP